MNDEMRVIIRSQENKKRKNCGQWRKTKHMGNSNFRELLWTEKLKGGLKGK